ncbi:MAG: sterol desaturase family protein [Gemmatimonadota bacterium]
MSVPGKTPSLRVREPEREMWERAARLPPRDPTVRIFQKDWQERLSRVPPYVPHLLYVPLVTFMLGRSLHLGVTVSRTLGLAGLGLLSWSVVEFLLHRYVFHEIANRETERRVKLTVHRLRPDEPILPRLTGWREKFYFVAHGVHHEFPSDPERLVMPPSVSIPLAVFFYFLFTLALGATTAPAYYAGFVLGYLIYDTFHYAVHFIRPGGMAEEAMYRVGKGHMRHHFSDNHKDYGVSSPVWDLLIGTFDWKERSQFHSPFLQRWIAWRRRRGG